MNRWKTHLGVWLPLICLIAGASAVSADYPLEVKWAFNMPAGSGLWDVQYWMSDTTIGYVYGRPYGGDSICYAVQPDQPIVKVLVHATWACFWQHTGYGRMLRLATRPSAPVISVLQEILTNCEYGVLGQVIYTVDLETDSVLDVEWCSWEDAWYTKDAVQWPPPPDACQTVAISTVTVYYFDAIECDGYFCRGSGHLYNILADTLQSQSFWGCSVSPFRSFDTNPAFALWNYYYRYAIGDWCNEDPCYGYFSRVTLGQTQQNGDVLWGMCSPYVVTAQTDSDGTQRVIPSWTLMALNPQTWDTLWRRSPIPNDGVFSARLTDSPDERILLWQAGEHEFTVLSAVDGSVLGRTAPFLGDFHHIIKRRNHPDEIVTVYDPPGPGNWQVLVYAFGVPSVAGLTICHVPAADVIQLRWQPREGADGYHVKASSAVNGEYQEIAVVPSVQNYYDVPLTEIDSLHFFHVTAAFDSVR